MIRAIIAALAFASAATAGPCRDAATGKFIKCPVAVVVVNLLVARWFFPAFFRPFYPSLLPLKILEPAVGRRTHLMKICIPSIWYAKTS